MSRRAPTQFPYGMLTDDAGASADPVLVEIVQGSLASVEMEVETAIGRTSRSPMIRDAHDFRAGIHDRLLRKLTGRSYSALVHPVARDFPLEEMREGDVFFHNDVYRSEGGIGHLPDLCVTVPVFAGGAVVAFVQAFGHHDDIGGAVPGSMPSHATSVFEEGLMVPPIRLWDAGVPNRAALAIMTRNSRMPESLAADLDAECSACLMGARRLGELFERYGVDVVESCFDAIIDRTTTTYRREILSQIPVGSWTWEDYAEHDGVDEPRLHTQRITLTRTPADDPDGERLVLDFDGTGPQAKGPINHCGDYSDGVFLKKWLAPILRNLAESPERMAELDVNEGIVPLIEMRFPEPGTLLTPVFPAPTNARTFVILRLLGVLAGVVAKAVDGRMPADQETIRYTGVYGEDRDGRSYLMREVLGGGSGGPLLRRRRGHHPRGPRLPQPADRVHRVALPVPRRVARAGDGLRRGGGAPRRPRLREAHPDAQGRPLHVDRGPLDPGLLGGPWRPGRQAVRGHHRPRRAARAGVDALADDEPVRAGEVIRIRTTGGGGWGDPLVRDPALVVRDVVWRKVSPEAALADYGVVLTGSLDADDLGFDAGRDRGRAGRAGPRGRVRSSTAAPAMPGCPAAPPPPRWTTCDGDHQGGHGAGRRRGGAHLGDRLAGRSPRPRPRGARRDAYARVLRRPRRGQGGGHHGRPRPGGRRRLRHGRGGRGGAGVRRPCPPGQRRGRRAPRRGRAPGRRRWARHGLARRECGQRPCPRLLRATRLARRGRCGVPRRNGLGHLRRDLPPLHQGDAMKVLVALGGNAMTNAEGRARPEDQIAAAETAMEAVADLVAAGVEVVVTHGNGPQVGNLLVKNELAAAVVPPVPLDWCGAQTQGTLGFVLMDALDASLARRGVDRRCAAVVTRTRVDADDAGFDTPTKPIGRYLPAEEARHLIEHGETWQDRGDKGWRRVVASPEPLEVVDAPAVRALVEAGFVVIANGGGGIPVVRREDGVLAGVEAVIDKDLGPRCWRGRSPSTCSSSPPTCPTRSCTSAPRRPPRSVASPSPRCARSPPRATSPAGRWGPRSTPPAGSSRTAASAP